jgi:hypothetical protein
VGLVIQASLTHPEMARALGHDVPRMFTLVFASGAALAGLAGVIGGNYQTTEPSMAFTMGPIVFVVVVFGGLGSLLGCFIASLLMGLIQTFAVVFDSHASLPALIPGLPYDTKRDLPPVALLGTSAMVIATAGFTAALCVMALQKHGLQPGDGEVLVTGAAGGVGSIAVALLGKLGYNVVASTGRPQEADYLTRLGAARIVDRKAYTEPGKPLQKETWAGVVDTVGSHTLANACAATRFNGAVAACGLAQGGDFPTTVMPFILRGVTLYGINSVFVPNAQRAEAWARMAKHLDAALLDSLVTEIGLSEAIAYAPKLLAGEVRGRTVVNTAR